jgi:hypothetical protein
MKAMDTEKQEVKQVEVVTDPIAEVASVVSQSRNPDDLADLCISQEYGTQIAVKKVITTVRIQKPDKQWFVQVRADSAWRRECYLLDCKEDREMYLVTKGAWPAISARFPGFAVPVVLHAGITSHNVPFLWPIRLPGPDGKSNPWHESARRAVEEASKGIWVQVISNQVHGCYDVFRSEGSLPDPDWPVDSFEELLRIAMKDRIIKDLDHYAVKKLRGIQA